MKINNEAQLDYIFWLDKKKQVERLEINSAFS